MELHEYQAKLLLARFGVPSPPHVLLDQGCDLATTLAPFTVEPLVVKAQVHGRGRKEAGGEIGADRPNELLEAVKRLLGARIVTSESGPEGFVAAKVLVMPLPSFVKKFQVKLFLTALGAVGVRACQEGGRVFTEHPFEGYVRPFQMARLAGRLGLRGSTAELFRKVLEGIVRAFFHFEALLIDIDSLVLTENGRFQVLDVRMVIDDRALTRQQEVFHMKDMTQAGPRIRTPPHICLAMGGKIGCVGNGLGLALSTADLVCLFQGLPGNVVNIGSELSADVLVEGLHMARANDPAILFVNLFTGLVDGLEVAHVLKNELSSVPMVVRLEGTNSAGGRRLLHGLEPQCTVTASLDEAAKAAVDHVNP